MNHPTNPPKHHLLLPLHRSFTHNWKPCFHKSSPYFSSSPYLPPPSILNPIHPGHLTVCLPDPFDLGLETMLTLPACLFCFARFLRLPLLGVVVISRLRLPMILSKVTSCSARLWNNNNSWFAQQTVRGLVGVIRIDLTLIIYYYTDYTQW